MKSAALRVLAGSVLLSAAAQPAVAGSSHRRLHGQHGGNRNHTDGHELDLVKKNKLVNRAGQCAFPEDAGLVAITPDSSNSGWAMSPDQECTAGSYCPFACPPGKLMNQWKLGTTYIYPESMYGGLYCDEDGAINKPFPSEEYCVEGMGNVKAVNNCGKTVSFCQTVLPGNENMLIPTAVDSTATLAVPGTSYWDATAAHYYINEPGYTTDEACGWGTSAKPIGNWAAYVAGANQDAMGNTYVKLGWNPIYTGDYSGVKPSFGIKIECDGDCVGLPCSIDPSTDGFGGVNSLESSTGAGGADFCVVTVTSGSANIVVFNVDGSTGDKSSTSTSTVATSSSSSEAVPKETPTTTAALVVALNAKPTSSSSPPTTLSSSTSSETTTTETSTTHPSTTSSFTAPALSSSSHQASTKTANPTLSGGVFQETGTSSNRTISSAKATTLASTDSPSGITAAPEPAAMTSKENHASDPRQNQAAFAGLVVAIVAAACLY